MGTHPPQFVHVLEVLGVEFTNVDVVQFAKVGASHSGQRHRHGVCGGVVGGRVRQWLGIKAVGD